MKIFKHTINICRWLRNTWLAYAIYFPMQPPLRPFAPHVMGYLSTSDAEMKTPSTENALLDYQSFLCLTWSSSECGFECFSYCKDFCISVVCFPGSFNFISCFFFLFFWIFFKHETKRKMNSKLLLVIWLLLW